MAETSGCVLTKTPNICVQVSWDRVAGWAGGNGDLVMWARRPTRLADLRVRIGIQVTGHITGQVGPGGSTRGKNVKWGKT